MYQERDELEGDSEFFFFQKLSFFFFLDATSLKLVFLLSFSLDTASFSVILFLSVLVNVSFLVKFPSETFSVSSLSVTTVEGDPQQVRGCKYVYFRLLKCVD